MNCKNGCDAPRYLARLVCQACVAKEQLARKRAKQGPPKKQGRPKSADGVLQHNENKTKPLPGFNPFSNDWAKRPLRVSQ